MRGELVRVQDLLQKQEERPAQNNDSKKTIVYVRPYLSVWKKYIVLSYR